MANYDNISVMDADLIFDIERTATDILKATDWTQLPDSGLTDNCVALFKTYRASIRNIKRTNPSNPTWPDAPTEEWS